MIKFLRIFSFIVAFPAIIFFFYVILKMLDSRGGSGAGSILSVFIAFCILFVPVIFNRLAWILEKVRNNKR